MSSSSNGTHFTEYLDRYVRSLSAAMVFCRMDNETKYMHEGLCRQSMSCVLSCLVRKTIISVPVSFLALNLNLSITTTIAITITVIQPTSIVFWSDSDIEHNMWVGFGNDARTHKSHQGRGGEVIMRLFKTYQHKAIFWIFRVLSINTWCIHTWYPVMCDVYCMMYVCMYYVCCM